MDIEGAIEAWRTNDRLNVRWLDLVADEDMELKPGSGKTVRSNFVHLVGVRRMWMEERLPAVAKEMPRLDWKNATRAEIADGLARTGEAMESLLRRIAEKPGRWSLPMFLAYAVAHEAHHRSQIEIALRLAKRDPDDGTLYSLWDWTKL